MAVQLREMTLADYDEVYALWAASEGIGLSSADSREAIGAFLQRNPGLAFVAVDGDVIAGAVICGTDGRRGYLHHLAVRSSHKRQGIGRHLAQACLDRLREQGLRNAIFLCIGKTTPPGSFGNPLAGWNGWNWS